MFFVFDALKTQIRFKIENGKVCRVFAYVE